MELVGNVSLGDVHKAWQGAKSIDTNPLRLVGRMAGLGSEELDAGVPTWAWVTVAFGAGALFVVLCGDRISSRVRSVF